MEIEFKGKVKYNGNHYHSGEWVKGTGIQVDGDKVFLYDNELIYMNPFGEECRSDEWVEIIPETRGQYIGKKDMHENKIYDSDLLADEDDIWVVEWDDCEAKYILVLDNVAMDFSNIDSRWLEIVGNVHDKEEIHNVD